MKFYATYLVFLQWWKRRGQVIRLDSLGLMVNRIPTLRKPISNVSKLVYIIPYFCCIFLNIHSCIYIWYMIVAPNGVYYVKKERRRGVLCRLLMELLQTRVMVKNAMKRKEYSNLKVSNSLKSTDISSCISKAYSSIYNRLWKEDWIQHRQVWSLSQM